MDASHYELDSLDGNEDLRPPQLKPLDALLTGVCSESLVQVNLLWLTAL